MEEVIVSQKQKELQYREFADNYDKEVRAYNSYGHEVIFGMSYEYINPGEKLLDIGIGTGLASIHFAETGLKVYGLDYSQDMLDACKAKSFTEELSLFDIAREKIPYRKGFFDHAVCCGVLHFVDDLTQIFSEIKRVVRSGGIIAFSFAPHGLPADFLREDTDWGVPIFRHSPLYINNLLKNNNMELLKEQRLLIKGADKINFSMHFAVMICRSL